MQTDLEREIARLFPDALNWVEKQSNEILETGRHLSSEETELAKKVGVTNPDRIRICEVAQLPLPENVELREIALSLGLLGPSMVGLTLGYGIYLVEGYQNRFIPHELRHVQQFEMAGSISDFLAIYLHQLAKFGYTNAPLEIDAREHESI